MQAPLSWRLTSLSICLAGAGMMIANHVSVLQSHYILYYPFFIGPLAFFFGLVTLIDPSILVGSPLHKNVSRLLVFLAVVGSFLTMYFLGKYYHLNESESSRGWERRN